MSDTETVETPKERHTGWYVIDGWQDPVTNLAHFSMWPEARTECGIATDGSISYIGEITCGSCCGFPT